MKNAPLTLEFGTVRLPISADGLLHAPTALTHLGLNDTQHHAAALEHDLNIEQRDFGLGPEAALSLADFVRLSFTLTTPQARRWRKRAQDTLVRALQGDVRLAAQIAERNPNPEERRWLTARLESTHARRELMSTVARHGGQGNVYGQLGSISNRSVLGTDSATIRRQRGVKQTRDGLSSTELLRLAYLDTATTRAIQDKGAHGNDAILKLHGFVARRERLSWETPLPGTPLPHQAG